MMSAPRYLLLLLSLHTHTHIPCFSSALCPVRPSVQQRIKSQIVFHLIALLFFPIDRLKTAFKLLFTTTLAQPYLVIPHSLFPFDPPPCCLIQQVTLVVYYTPPPPRKATKLQQPVRGLAWPTTSHIPTYMHISYTYMQVRYASTISFYRRIVYGLYNYPDSFCFVSLPTRFTLSC
jgi:hypothetical protein